MSNLRNQLQTAAAEYSAAKYPGDLAADTNAREAIDATQADYATAKYPGDLAADLQKRKMLSYQPAAGGSPWLVRSLSIAAAIIVLIGGGIFANRLYEQHEMQVAVETANQQLDILKATVLAQSKLMEPVGIHIAVAPNPSLATVDPSTASADRLPAMTDALAALDSANDSTADTIDAAVASDSTSNDSPALTVIQSPDTISASLPSMDTFPSVPSFPSFDASDSSSTSNKS